MYASKAVVVSTMATAENLISRFCNFSTSEYRTIFIFTQSEWGKMSLKSH